MADNPQRSPTQPIPEEILHRIDWQVIRRLDGLLQGDYRTLFYGAGIDFSDLREYQPRDDIRHIDWNVTARMDTPYVRQYVEDREITAWFLLDMTRSMSFGPHNREKRMLVVDFVASMARMLTRSGNRVGAIIFYGKRSEIVHLPPQATKNQVLRLIRELERDSPPDGESGQSTRLTTLLDRAVATIKRRSLVLLISDFISEPGWDKPLSLLNRKHECLAVRLWDPLEYELPSMGLIVVEDIETGEQLRVNTSDPAFQARFSAAANRREKELNEMMRSAGIDLYGLSTADSVVDAILRLARRRQTRRRVAR